MTALLRDALLVLHVACGFVALVVLWIPLFSRKGGRLHRTTGKLYALLMLVVVVTALVLSGLSFVVPVALDPDAARLTGEPLADFVRQRRMVAGFLAYLALITLTSGWHGLGALRHKRDPREMRTPPTLALFGASILAGPMEWWFEHMGGMIGTAIAANTAFLVFGGNRLLPFELEGWLGVAPWLLPTLIGVPAIYLLERKYRARFAQREGAAGA